MSGCLSLPKTQQYLEREVLEARADIRRLQEEITALRQKVIDLRHSLIYERCQNKMSKRKLDDSIRCNEIEKKNILSKQNELLTKIQVLEDTVECLNKRVQDMIAEKVFWQSQCSNLKSLNERLEKSKRSIENSTNEMEEELSNLSCRAKGLEEEKRTLMHSLNEINNEVACLKDKLCSFMKENENLKECLDAKTKEVCSLERNNSKKHYLINQLEEKISRLNCELIRSNNEEIRLQKEISCHKKELHSALENNSILQVENRKLSANLDSVNNDLELKDCEYQKTRNDLNKLKEKMSCYAEQFKQMEQIIQEKNKEKEEVRYHLKTLQMKLSNLETTNQTLESTNNWTCNNLRVAKGKIEDLQTSIRTKDTVIGDMECQVKEMSNQLRLLKQELSKKEQINMKLTNEVATSKEVINSMECQQKKYQTEIRTMENKVDQVTDEICRSQSIIKELTTQLEVQKKTICALECAVSESRREAREESMQNLNVSQKVQELQDSVNKLQDKLCCVNNALAKCQSTCSEYKLQNNELKFELVNEKYAKTLTNEDNCKSINFRNSCFSCNKNPADMSTYYCSCHNKGRVYFRNKYKCLTDKTCNEVGNIDCGSGQFTISVNNDDTFSQRAPTTSASITVLDNTKLFSPAGTELVVKRKSSSNILTNYEESKNKDYVKSKSLSISNIGICDDARTNLLGGSPPRIRKSNSELKGILKDTKCSGYEGNDTREMSFHSTLFEANDSRRHYKQRHVDPTDVIISNHNSESSKNYSSDNGNSPLLSIAEESPPYRVTKKLYKKVCFSDSDEELPNIKTKHKI